MLDDNALCMGVCVCVYKHDTHGARQNIVGTRIQEMAFADPLICEFDSLPHGISLKTEKPEQQSDILGLLFNPYVNQSSPPTPSNKI